MREHIEDMDFFSMIENEKKYEKDYTIRSSSVNIDMSSLFTELQPMRN